MDKSVILSEIKSCYKFKSDAEFARKIGITPQNLSQWMKRNTYDIAILASAFPEVNHTWLLTGEGEMIKSNTSQPVESAPYSINQAQQGAPYYDVDFVGGFDVVVNDQTINPAYHIDFAEYNKADCWVNVTGHSMEPTISHGDIVALRELKEWEDHILLGEIYAIVTNEYRTLKKVRKSSKGDDYLLIIPTNKDYDEQDIPKRIINKVYQVLGAAKKIF